MQPLLRQDEVGRRAIGGVSPSKRPVRLLVEHRAVDVDLQERRDRTVTRSCRRSRSRRHRRGNRNGRGGGFVGGRSGGSAIGAGSGPAVGSPDPGKPRSKAGREGTGRKDVVAARSPSIRSEAEGHQRDRPEEEPKDEPHARRSPALRGEPRRERCERDGHDEEHREEEQAPAEDGRVGGRGGDLGLEPRSSVCHRPC